jgi:uncharacterized protein (DUF2147 family)
MFKTAAAIAALWIPAATFAQATPVGLWKTIDDETKAEKSLVRIADSGGVLTGKIEKVLDPSKAADVCDKCTDERKGQPIVGLTIIRNAKGSSDDPGLWAGGEILDPNNGKTYKLRLKPIEEGKKLEVRGYVGAPLLGRTQTWIRVE